jgi:sialate O-acetylesterase
MFKSAKVEDGKVIVELDHVGEGLILSDGGKAAKGFILAGPDGNFVVANAEITSQNQITVSHPSIKSPTEIRYAWADNPEVNLYNSEKLPAVPFRKTLGN